MDRPVWRIRDDKAILVVYEIHRGPNGEHRSIDGVKPLPEFGLEIDVAVAFLVQIVGLSMEKVCSLLKFFWQLELSRSFPLTTVFGTVCALLAGTYGGWTVAVEIAVVGQDFL